MSIVIHFLAFGLLLHLTRGTNPHFWTYSSCTTDSKSWISNSFHEGVPIKSWIQSVVPTFDDSGAFTQLGSHFVQRLGTIKPDLIVQYPERPKSLAWKAFGSKPQDGWLYGYLHPQSIGNNIAYIYDDFKTAIVGSFVNGTMISGTKGKVMAFRCKSGFMELDIETFSQKSLYSYIGMQFNMDKLSKEAVDPLDFENTFVQPSKIAGEGLFAKKTLSMGSVIAIYSGKLVDNSSKILHVKDESLKEELHKNLLTLNKTFAIDIPPTFGSLKKYKGSYGHKANHSFKRSNAYFGRIKSPRFGETRCLMAKNNVDKGEEILVDYNYDLKTYVPQWYKKLYVDTFGEGVMGKK